MSAYPLLRRYLLKAAAGAPDPMMQNQLIQLLHQLSGNQQASNADASIQDHEDEEVIEPELTCGIPSQNKQPKGIEDIMLRQAMPEMERPNPETPEVFGKPDRIADKNASVWSRVKSGMQKKAAYIKDIRVSELPEKTRGEVARFISKNTKDPMVIHYGMVLKELEDRVDPHNYQSANATVRKETAALTKAAKEGAKDALHKKIKDKYILIVNDQIVDGHHFLAKARALGVTSSLNVLDLTPARFQ